MKHGQKKIRSSNTRNIEIYSLTWRMEGSGEAALCRFVENLPVASNNVRINEFSNIFVCPPFFSTKENQDRRASSLSSRSSNSDFLRNFHSRMIRSRVYINLASLTSLLFLVFTTIFQPPSHNCVPVVLEWAACRGLNTNQV